MNLSLLLFGSCLKPFISLPHPLKDQLTVKDSHIGLAIIHKEENIFFKIIAKNAPMRILYILISQNKHFLSLLLPELMHPIMFTCLPELEADLIAYCGGCGCISVGYERMEGRMSHALHEQDAYINTVSFYEEIFQLVLLLEVGVIVGFTYE